MQLSLIDIAKGLAVHLGLFAFVLVLLAEIRASSARLRGPYVGAALGLTAVVGMLMPIHVGPGLFLDPRGVMVSLAGAFGGPRGGFVAALLTGGFRLVEGGSGAVVATISITFYALAGIAVAAVARVRCRPIQVRDLPPLVILQLVVMLSGFAFFASQTTLALFPIVAPMLGGMIVVATPALGLLLVRAEER